MAEFCEVRDADGRFVLGRCFPLLVDWWYKLYVRFLTYILQSGLISHHKQNFAAFAFAYYVLTRSDFYMVAVDPPHMDAKE